MTRAYIRLDPAFDERKESYPDGPYAALIGTFCLAEAQPDRGRFRSLDYLKRLLGRRGRHVQYLVEHKDIVLLKDGRVYIDGWDEWQEGDVTVKERVQRLRARRGNAGGNGPRNGPERSTPVTLPVRSELSGAEHGVAADRASAMSDEEQRSQLDKLADVLEANGALPAKRPNGEQRPYQPVTDTEVIERARTILADESQPDWKRQAARDQLEVMGMAP